MDINVEWYKHHLNAYYHEINTSRLLAFGYISQNDFKAAIFEAEQVRQAYALIPDRESFRVGFLRMLHHLEDTNREFRFGFDEYPDLVDAINTFDIDSQDPYPVIRTHNLHETLRNDDVWVRVTIHGGTPLIQPLVRGWRRVTVAFRSACIAAFGKGAGDPVSKVRVDKLTMEPFLSTTQLRMLEDWQDFEMEIPWYDWGQSFVGFNAGELKFDARLVKAKGEKE
jgi:hypothetical protein